MLDTVCTIRAKGKDAKEAVDAAFKRIDEVEKYVNYFDENSTIAKFNRASENEKIILDRDTREILKTVFLVCEKSNGAYDPTVAAVNDLWDFKSENATVPSSEKIQEQLKTVGYESVEFDYETSTIWKKKNGTKIDLGGSAKGYAADCAAEILQMMKVDYGVIDLGGNVKVIGKNPKRSEGSWQIGIQKPFAKNGSYDRVISVLDSSIVTSGNYQRYFKVGDDLYHHIINPENGMPVNSEYDGVTVVAQSALLADCLSTACMVLGKDKATALAEEFDAEIYFSYR